MFAIENKFGKNRNRSAVADSEPRRFHGKMWPVHMIAPTVADGVIDRRLGVKRF